MRADNPYIKNTVVATFFGTIVVARTLRQFDVNVAHKPVKTVGLILKKPKDKFDQHLSTGVVYKINCENCEKL